MKVLALDPSSTCVGYAVLAPPRSLIDAGRLLPARTRDDANTRIRAMSADLGELIEQHRPDEVVIEDTSGKVGARHNGGGAGLAVYGKAVGYVIRSVEQITGKPAVCVPENAWTRGVSKMRRMRTVAAEFHAYDPVKDPGGDVADAIGLARWFLAEVR